MENKSELQYMGGQWVINRGFFFLSVFGEGRVNSWMKESCRGSKGKGGKGDI